MLWLCNVLTPELSSESSRGLGGAKEEGVKVSCSCDVYDSLCILSSYERCLQCSLDQTCLEYVAPDVQHVGS
jgi:hypothetical protein